MFELSDSKLPFDESQKSIALQLVTQGKYNENDVIFIRVKDDLSEGFALTKDSFCVYGDVGNKIIYYDSLMDIKKVYESDLDFFTILEISYGNNEVFSLRFWNGIYDLRISECLYNYLNTIRNMIVK